MQTKGFGWLNEGRDEALASLTSASGMMAPLQTKYGEGTDLYLDSLGVNGPEGNTRATGAFQAGPGYQWNIDQALDGVMRQRNAMGQGGFQGNTLAALSDRAGNMANQEYGGWQTRLAGLINPEMAAAGAGAGYEAAKAPVWANDANARVGLASGVTGGLNSQATQSANAEMAGSGNLWGLGLNLAKLGTGMLGGMGGLNPTGVGAHVPGGYSAAFPKPF